MITNDGISILSSPLSTVIVGSIVGAVVGFFLNYETTRMTRKAEQKKAIQDHIREYSTLALQVNDWFKAEHNILWSFYELPNSVRGKTPVNQQECPIDRLIMLSRLYLPELKKETIELSESVDEVQESFANFVDGNYPIEDHYHEGSAFENQYYAAILSNVRDSFHTSYTNLLSSLEKLSCKYR